MMDGLADLYLAILAIIGEVDFERLVEVKLGTLDYKGFFH